MVNAFRQLANATRLVGFCVMQFTIDLKGTHARIKIRTPRRNRDIFQEWKGAARSYMCDTCVAAQPMLNTAAKKL
jgi:hypothetical protein